MKKVMDGAVYNTETAKKICEQQYNGPDYTKGAIVDKLTQLFKTRSNKFFFYEYIEFRGHADVNNDDLNPKMEEMDLIDEKIIPVSYDVAFQFASEADTNPASQKIIRTYFPELLDKESDGSKKIQKNIYLSEKHNWYLELLLQTTGETNGSLIEKLIFEKYQNLYQQGMMTRDPFHEMEDEPSNK